MSFRHGSKLLRFIATIAFLCLIGQGLAVELQHVVSDSHHSHSDDHQHPSDIPDGESQEHPEHSHHHHLADMIPAVAERESLFAFSSVSYSISRDTLPDSPVIGIEYPPQLS